MTGGLTRGKATRTAQRKEGCVEVGAETGAMGLQAKADPGGQLSPGIGREAWNILPQNLQKEPTLLTP